MAITDMVTQVIRISSQCAFVEPGIHEIIDVEDNDIINKA